MSQVSETENKQHSDLDKQMGLEFKSMKKRVLKRPTAKTKASKSYNASFLYPKRDQKFSTTVLNNSIQSQTNYLTNRPANIGTIYDKPNNNQSTKLPFEDLINSYEIRGVTRKYNKNQNIGFHLRPSTLRNVSFVKADGKMKNDFSQLLTKNANQNTNKAINDIQNKKNSQNNFQIYRFNHRLPSNSFLTKTTEQKSSTKQPTIGRQLYNINNQQNQNISSYSKKSLTQKSSSVTSLTNIDLKFTNKQKNISYNFSKNNKHMGNAYQLTSNKSISIKMLSQKVIKIAQFQLGFCQNQDFFGKTFPARHIKTGFILCIKQITKRNAKHDVEKLVQYLKIQSLCNSQYIVQIYGFIQDKEKVYVLMEYHDEGRLFLKLKSQKCIATKDVLTYLQHIAQGVRHLHSKNVVYRNLKPQNISFFYDTCKLSNLSWSCRQDKQKNNCSGIIEYSSPELLSKGKYSKQCDVWALGVVLYQMVFGVTPCHTLSHKRAISKIINHQFQLIPQTNPHLTNLLKKILKKNTIARITISQLIQQIQYALQQID